MGRRHRKAVDVIRTGNPSDPVHHRGRTDGKTDAQACQARGFGQGAQHQQIGGSGEIRQRKHAVAREGLVELIHHHQGAWGRRRQLENRFRRQARAGGVVGIADQQDPRGPPAGLGGAAWCQHSGTDLLQREGEIGQPIRDRLDRHALHLGAGSVITEGGASGEQRLAPVAIGVKDGVNRRIHPVEQADLAGLQRQGQVGEHRIPQAVVLGVDGVVLGANRTDCLHHPGARAHRVLVEVKPQQPTPPLQRSAVGLEALHLRAGLGELWPRRIRALLWVHHIRSRVGIPSRPNPSLRLSAVRRQRARREERAGSAALSTGTWS